MKLKFGILAAGIIAGVLPAATWGDVIVQYNFGSISTTGETLATMEAPTTVSSNVSTTSVSLGTTATAATNEGPTVATFYTSPASNSLSVANTSASSDLNYYVDFTVTANAGFTFTPTGFTLVGGAGGASNTRSFLLFDNVDGFPTSITATATTPTVVGGTQLGGGTFTAVRSTGVPMNSFTVTSFTGADQNLTSFEVRAFFDTQLNGQAKNIDLGSLTLNGTFSPVAAPEPGALGYMALAAMGVLAFPRRLKICR